MNSNQSRATGVSYQFLGIVVAAIAFAIGWVGYKLSTIHEDHSSIVIAAVLFAVGMGITCTGFVRDGRAAQGY